MTKPEESQPKNRKLSLWGRAVCAGSGFSATVVGCRIYANHESFGPRYASFFLGAVGVAAFITSLIPNTEPNQGRGNGGGSWESPEIPEPRGPGGIPVDEDFIAEIEEYLQAKELTSV